jgi:hypothetical protein
MSVPDSAGRNREFHAAAQRSVLVEKLQAKGSIIKFVLLSEGDRQCCFEAIILLLFYYYSDYSSYYTHYSQNKTALQMSIHCRNQIVQM